MSALPVGAPPLDLPDDFSFSQSGLQTFIDCRRRFWLGIVQRLPWPAVEAAPVQEHEYLARLGTVFHRLVQRAEIGLDPDLLAQQLGDPLDVWFDGYRQHRPSDLPTTRVEVEHTLTIPFQSVTFPTSPPYRLVAKYDLLAIEPGARAVIMDWKTNRVRPEPTALRDRLQSQVYPYVLVEASRFLPWGPIAPEQVEMRYWFATAPDQPIILRYDAAQHAAIGQQLQRLLDEILAGRTAEDFPKVPDTEHNRARFCGFCTYRSRCDRGIVPNDVNLLVDVDDQFYEPDLREQELEIHIEEVPIIAF